MSGQSSPFPSCFRLTAAESQHALPPPPPPLPPPPPNSGNLNVTTCIYHTDIAAFSLTWSRSFLGRSLRLNLHHRGGFDSPPHPLHLSSPSPYFHLHIKPFIFWKKHGSKKLAPNIRIFWELSRAKFGSGPDPQSGFYIAVVVDGAMSLLVGDLTKEAYAKTKAQRSPTPQVLVLKREHVVADRICTTRARFGGKSREIQIDCGHSDCARLNFIVDGERVLQVKRLKWKFRGNERVEIDGVHVQISWDVYNWLFDGDSDDGHAVFMFKFEEEEEGEEAMVEDFGDRFGGQNGNMDLWGPQQQQQQCYWNSSGSSGGMEWRKIGKSFSSSSVSMSSGGSSGGGSSVLEWSSMEESELSGGPFGFSLLLYAWRRS